MESRQIKIRLLARQNVRRLRLPRFLADASEVIGEPVGANAVLDINATDLELTRFWADYKNVINKIIPGFRVAFKMEEERRLISLVDCLAESNAKQRAIWLTNAEGEPIAVEIELVSLLHCFKSALMFDRNSISAVSHNHSQGLLLDYNADDLQSSYELTIWGDGWRSLALSCANQ